MSVSTSRAAIENRLKTQLAAEYPSLVLVFENTKAKKPDDGPHVSYMILEGDARRANLGPTRTVRQVGVLQIDCMYPKDTGTGPVERLATFCGSLFDEWSIGLSDNASLHFRVPQQKNHGVKDELHRISVSIPYWRDER